MSFRALTTALLFSLLASMQAVEAKPSSNASATEAECAAIPQDHKYELTAAKIDLFLATDINQEFMLFHIAQPLYTAVMADSSLSKKEREDLAARIKEGTQYKDYLIAKGWKCHTYTFAPVFTKINPFIGYLASEELSEKIINDAIQRGDTNLLKYTIASRDDLRKRIREINSPSEMAALEAKKEALVLKFRSLFAESGELSND